MKVYDASLIQWGKDTEYVYNVTFINGLDT